MLTSRHTLTSVKPGGTVWEMKIITVNNKNECRWDGTLAYVAK